MKKEINKILNVIRKNHDFLITTHINPEGDAIGSELALGIALSSIGKNVSVINHDPVPSRYRFLPWSDRVKTEYTNSEKFDAAFVLDCSSIDRTGSVGELIKRAELIVNIDHHLTALPFAHISYVDSSASATGELVYEIIKRMKIKINKEIATNLYTAIFVDTGSFRYSNTTPSSMRIAAELLESGVDPWYISEKIYETQPLERLRLLALTLGTLEIVIDGRVASIVITREMLERTGSTIETTEDLINYPRSIENIEVAVLFREEGENLYKVSFRSKGRVNVAEICEIFGGGGHHGAAGCNIKGSLGEVKSIVYEILKRYMESKL